MCSFVTLVIGIVQTCLTINSQLLLFLPRAPGPYPLGYGPRSTCSQGKTRAWIIQIPATLPACVPPPRTCAVFVRATASATIAIQTSKVSDARQKEQRLPPKDHSTQAIL
eukprot:scaffold32359_cov47-Phaeocystis_antarctica.AAC.1